MVPPGGVRIAQADWLIPRQTLAALLALYPDLLLIAPGRHRWGQPRPVPHRVVADQGPQRTAPCPLGPCEAPCDARDHERAAYDIAGAGLHILRRHAA